MSGASAPSEADAQMAGAGTRRGPRVKPLVFWQRDYPFSDSGLLAGRKAMYLYVPMAYFHSNAVTLHNLSITDQLSKKYWHQVIENFIEMAHSAHDSSMRDEPSVVVLLHMLESQEAAYRTSGLLLTAY